MTGRKAGRVLVMLWVALTALGVAAAAAPAISIERVGPAMAASGLVATPDGGVARLTSYPYGSPVAAQSMDLIDARGGVRTIQGPRGVAAASAPIVLADGSFAFEGMLIDDASARAGKAPPRALVTFPLIRPPRAVPLSDSNDGSWSPTAIAPDGAAWRARVCSGLLSRTAPHGAETRIQLPSPRCNGEVRAGSAFAFGPDGAVWFAALCRAWIARVPLAGRARVWRLSPRRHCEPNVGALRAPRPRLLATQDGGVRFEDGRIDARGRLVLDRSGILPDAIAPDGAEWRVNAHELVRRSRSGRVARTPVPAGDGMPRQFAGGAIGPDGRLWYTSAVPVTRPSVEPANSSMHVGAVDAAGRTVDAPLPPDDAASVSVQPVAAVGAVWLNSPLGALRVGVRPPRGSREAEASATRFLARRGATVWVQVRCSAPPGTFCSSTLKLFGSWARIAVHRAHLSVPAGEARAIPLTLTRRAMARLRKQGHLDPYTAIDVGGGYVAGRIHVR